MLTLQFTSDSTESGEISQVSLLLALNLLYTLRA